MDIIYRAFDGKEFENKVESCFIECGRQKHYCNGSYWKKIANFNNDTDECIILNRSSYFYNIQKRKKDGLMVKMSLQDIAILVCRK